MKTLYCFIVATLLCVVPLSAQKPVQELPEMQEWYRWDGAQGGYISYLPGFSADGGMNAITQKRDGDPTWFNRFAYDTTNQFSWNGGAWTVVQLDLNGDGIPDYIDGEGRVYQGLEKGKPPGAGFGRYERGGDKFFVADFNKDGFDDMLTPTNEAKTFRIIFGGKDLTRLRSTQGYYLRPYSTGVSAYINEKGEPRLLTFYRTNVSEGFYLDALQFETKGDSIVVSLKQLSSIQETKADKNQQIFYPTMSGLYINKAANERTFLVSTKAGDIRMYSTVMDKFSLQLTQKRGIGYLYLLQGSVDGDSIPDITTMIFYNNVLRACIISGSPLLGFEPRAILGAVSGKCDITSSTVFYIGDVTGDGIGDIGIADSYSGCFSIFKGIDWRKLSVVAETGKPDFTLRQTEPNPVSPTGMAILPATLAHAGEYMLEVYDLTGKRLGELFKGELPVGDVRIPLNIKSLNIAAGMFTLRLSDGRHTQERAFVITK